MEIVLIYIKHQKLNAHGLSNTQEIHHTVIYINIMKATLHIGPIKAKLVRY